MSWSPSTSALGNAFAGRRVLVTGHSGFKGAWLCAWLLELGAEPFGYALAPPTRPSLFEGIDLAERMDSRVGDVRDLAQIAERVREVRPDVIFHMAAQSLVRESYHTPHKTFETNVMGTTNVLEAVRLYAQPCLVVTVASDKCYDSPGSRPCTEEDPLGGHDPYSASKGAAEIVVSAYRRSFFPPDRYQEHGVALASVRAGNVIGGGDWAADRLVPDVVRAVAAGRVPRLRAPEAVRPWQHVLDCLSGYLWLAALMRRDGAEGLAAPWNFGPDDAGLVTVAELTERILHGWTDAGWQPAPSPGVLHETEVLRLDAGKAARRLGWRPVWDVGAAIEATVRWYRGEHDGDDMAGMTSRQILAHGEQASRQDLPWALETGAETAS